MCKTTKGPIDFRYEVLVGVEVGSSVSSAYDKGTLTGSTNYQVLQMSDGFVPCGREDDLRNEVVFGVEVVEVVGQ